MPGVTGMIADISPAKDKARTLVTCQLLSIQALFWVRDWWILAEFSHRAPFYFAGTLGVLAFIMSLLLIHNPRKETTEGFHSLEPEVFTKINWKVFITPIILTLVLAFGLSAFETLFSLYTAEKPTIHHVIFQSQLLVVA